MNLQINLQNYLSIKIFYKRLQNYQLSIVYRYRTCQLKFSILLKQCSTVNCIKVYGNRSRNAQSYKNEF